MFSPSKKPDKAEMAQRLADELERVRLAEDKVREANHLLHQCKCQRDQALRDFQNAYRN